MAKYFIITGLPRSRSAWLASLFNTDSNIICFHEPVNECDQDYDRLKSVLLNRTEKYVGIADTSAGLNMEFYIQFHPRWVVINRDVNNAYNSLYDFLGLGESATSAIVDKTERGIRRIKRQNIYREFRYEDLDDNGVVKEVWDYCVPGIPFNADKCEIFQNLHINQHKDKIIWQLQQV